MMETPVVLVGLMGSGKSTVGQLVAEATDREFVDVDAAIKGRTGKSVRELWEEGGEEAYRDLERDEVLRSVERDGGVVVAAPGGVILDPTVRDALAETFVVWLRTTPATLGGRVRPGDHRPLLGDRPLDVLEEMADQRNHLYASLADVTVDTDDLSPDAAAAAIIDRLSDG